MDYWMLAGILTPVFAGWGILWFCIGFKRGWKESRRWGSP